MDVKRFAVSIQWGKGMHCFLGFRDDEETAQRDAKNWLRNDAKHNRRRGAKPTVYIWEQHVVLNA